MILVKVPKIEKKESTLIYINMVKRALSSSALLRNHEKGEDLYYLDVVSNMYKYFKFMMCFEFFRFLVCLELCSLCPGYHYLIIIGITCSILYLKFLISRNFLPSRSTTVTYCTVFCFSHKAHFPFQNKSNLYETYILNAGFIGTYNGKN